MAENPIKEIVALKPHRETSQAQVSSGLKEVIAETGLEEFTDLLLTPPPEQSPTASAEAWCRFGMALEQLGRLPDAITAFERSLTFDPLCENSLRKLPFVLHSVGDVSCATKAYLALLRMTPGEASALLNVAWLLMDQGRYRDLLIVFANFHESGGDDLRITLLACQFVLQSGAPEQVWPLLERSLASSPEDETLQQYFSIFGQILGNAAAVEHEIEVRLSSGDRPNAIAYARYALAYGYRFDDRRWMEWVLFDQMRDGSVTISAQDAKPVVAFRHYDLPWAFEWKPVLDRIANPPPLLAALRALLGVSKLEATVDHAAIDRAALTAGDPLLHFLVGAAYRLAQRWREAEHHLRYAAIDDPDQLGPRFELMVVQAQVRDWDGFGESIEKLRARAEHQIPTIVHNLAALIRNAFDDALLYELLIQFETNDWLPVPISVAPHGYRLFSSFQHPEVDMERLVQETSVYTAAVMSAVDRLEPQLPRTEYPASKARIGYFFGMGTSEYVFTPLNFRNTSKYHSILYLHDLVEPAQISVEHQSSFEKVRPLGALSDDEIVRIMLADDLDLLIVLDCVGYGAKDHVIARRPARRILYYGNVFAPSDLAAVDGLIAPATMASCFAKVNGEKAVISIPDWVNLVANLNGRFLEPLSESGDAVPTLGSIATGYKLNSAWFQMAARVLTRVPEARLRLDVPTVHDSGLRRLHGLAYVAGIDPSRLSINFATYGQDFAARLSTISLALDSFPVGSYFSAIQALSAGVPLLTFPGKTPLGLGAATVMNAAGLQDLVSTDLAMMEERAVALLRTPELLKGLRSRLPQAIRTSGLGDFAATAGAWEIALDQGLALPVRQIGKGRVSS